MYFLLVELVLMEESGLLPHWHDGLLSGDVGYQLLLLAGGSKRGTYVTGHCASISGKASYGYTYMLLQDRLRSRPILPCISKGTFIMVGRDSDKTEACGCSLWNF